MGRCDADGHFPMLREIERNETQARAESLLGQLEPRDRYEKDKRANTDAVLV